MTIHMDGAPSVMRNAVEITRITLVTLLVTALSGFVVASSASESWSHYEGRSSFTVLYPRDWSVIQKTPDRLDIVSPGKRAEGVVIAKGQSNILVNEVPSPGTKPLREVLPARDQTIDDRVLDLKQRGGDRCHEVEIVRRLVETIPEHPERETSLLCRIGKRVFQVTLLNWEEDGRNNLHVDVATTMVRSMRVHPE
jgi:hypothetical protein